jgi:hypothetical protein
MTWSLTEEALLVRIRVAAILTQMTFVPTPIAVMILALWHNHYFDLRIGVLAASSGMEACIAPLAPYCFKLWWGDLPGSSHDKSAGSSSGRSLRTLAVRCPMVLATTIIAMPALIILGRLSAGLLVYAELVFRVFWIGETIRFQMAYLATVVAKWLAFGIFRRHRSCDMANRRTSSVFG